ncbi:MAG: CehA/McbA family metallohydrolase, partial [Turicibacter sp.]|nr:CehA/McbA family metallohydrolase [Turicibacter sp.]
QTVVGNDEWVTSAQKLGYLAIPAQEVVTNEGHYLAINTTEMIDSSTLYSEEGINHFIEEVHHQKGLVQINHPSKDFPFWSMASEFDAIEIWNGQAMPPINDLPDQYAQWMINQKAKEKWFDLLSEGVKITALGNSDVYELRSQILKESASDEELFNEWVSQGLRVGSPRNYVKIDKLSVDGILKGIKEGHVFITNGPLMDITLNDVTFGDELEEVSEVEVSYLIASNHQNLDCLNIIADGEVIESVALAEDAPTLGTLTINLSNYHWVLFEVRTTSYEYAISNPIYLN